MFINTIKKSADITAHMQMSYSYADGHEGQMKKNILKGIIRMFPQFDLNKLFELGDQLTRGVARKDADIILRLISFADLI